MSCEDGGKPFPGIATAVGGAKQACPGAFLVLHFPPCVAAPATPIIKPKIVGGTPVTSIRTYPFMVSLQWAAGIGGHFCGGSVIGPRHVVTAGHCVQASDILLRLA